LNDVRLWHRQRCGLGDHVIESGVSYIGPWKRVVCNRECHSVVARQGTIRVKAELSKVLLKECVAQNNSVRSYICNLRLVDQQVAGGLSWVGAVAHKCRDGYSSVGCHIRVKVDFEAIVSVVVA